MYLSSDASHDAPPLTADRMENGTQEIDQAGEEEVNPTLYVGASLFLVAGLFLILFPSTAKKWFDTDPKYQIRPTPKSLELKSEASIRVLGIGLLLVAGLVAYYSYTVHF